MSRPRTQKRQQSKRFRGLRRGWSFPAGRNKYGAKRTVVDGITFASKAESRRYVELRALEQAGEISNLMLQVRFALHAGSPPKKLGSYVADFVYHRAGVRIVEDKKGFPTPLYKWKKRHMSAEHGINILES